MTRQTKPNEALATRKWFLLDATGQPLGRLAARVAHVLKGKHKPTYQPDVDTGDHVVIINAAKVKITGKKLTQKIAFRHSLYPGGARYERYDALMEKHPEKSIMLAVKGMLPRTPLGRKQMTHLLVYKGASYPQKSQKPEAFPRVIVRPS